MSTSQPDMPNDRIPPTSGRSQTDVVIEAIKEMITRGELAPGMRLPIERVLAANIGVSRGSLREGVRALAMMGVLETRQGDGTYVTSLDASLLVAPLGLIVDIQKPANSTHIQAVRRVLESEAVSLAATRITGEQLSKATRVLDDIEELVDQNSADHYNRVMEADIAFHGIIAQASGNPALEALIGALASRTLRARVWRTMSERGVMRTAQTEHRAILAGLRDRDGDRARIEMSHHLLGVERFIAEHANAGDETRA